MTFGTVAVEKRNSTILDRGLPPSLCNSQKYNIFFFVTTSQEKRLTLFLWHLWIHHQGVRGRGEGEEEGREGGGRLNVDDDVYVDGGGGGIILSMQDTST